MSDTYVDEENGSETIYYMALFPRIQHRFNSRSYRALISIFPFSSAKQNRYPFSGEVYRRSYGFQIGNGTVVQQIEIQP
jgi:hypothetical protein